MRGGTQKYAIKPNNQMYSARLRTHNFASTSVHINTQYIYIGSSELFLSLSAECQIPEKHIFCFGKKSALVEVYLIR